LPYAGKGLKAAKAWEYNPHMGAEVVPKLTYEQFRQLPNDGKRYELVRGEVHVTPAPSTRHQTVVHNLDMSLGTLVLNHQLGEV